MACLIQGSVVDGCVPQRFWWLPVLLALWQHCPTASLGWAEERRYCVQEQAAPGKSSNPEGRPAVVMDKMVPASAHSRRILLCVVSLRELQLQASPSAGPASCILPCHSAAPSFAR